MILLDLPLFTATFLKNDFKFTRVPIDFDLLIQPHWWTANFHFHLDPVVQMSPLGFHQVHLLETRRHEEKVRLHFIWIKSNRSYSGPQFLEYIFLHGYEPSFHIFMWPSPFQERNPAQVPLSHRPSADFLPSEWEGWRVNNNRRSIVDLTSRSSSFFHWSAVLQTESGRRDLVRFVKYHVATNNQSREWLQR